MNTARAIAIATLLASLSLATACARPSSTPVADQTAAPSPDAEHSTISNAISHATDKARKKIAEGNISISRNHQLAKAEITPKGDLLIDGRTVAITPGQRSQLLDYRGQIAAIAGAGMDIGMQGADLATKAMGEAFRGILSGNTDQVEQRVEAEAEKIKASAQKLCERMPALMESQQKLAAALPEFAPYATMTAGDVDDCRNDATAHDSHAPNHSEAAEAATASATDRTGGTPPRQ